MRDDTVYLRHIAESIDRVEQYLAGVGGALDESLFYDDPQTQDVEPLILILGIVREGEQP